MRLCSIASGSSGNCIYVGTEQTHVLVDAGISGKKIEQGLHQLDLQGKELDAILVTHEHSDHIQGLGVLARRYGIPIYTAHGTAQAIAGMKSLGKIPNGLIHEIQADHPFMIKDMEVKPFSISHDAAEPIGYRFENDQKSVAVATDLGVYTEYTVQNLKNLDALLLEANHDIRMLQVGSYPYYLKQRILGNKGHLSNENAGRLLCELLHDDMKHIFLGHLSKENNYEQLAYETVCAEITMGENPYKSDDFKIQIANREYNSEIVQL
ncbi:MAG: MBL fold metallo-hydrolase [Eubacteriales bacterium]|nr:MBL fold metallo-hydrolase [Eubacteriales bacterium]